MLACCGFRMEGDIRLAGALSIADHFPHADSVVDPDPLGSAPFPRIRTRTWVTDPDPDAYCPRTLLSNSAELSIMYSYLIFIHYLITNIVLNLVVQSH